MTRKTNPSSKVAKLATETANLPSDIILLGTFGPASRPRALLRRADGRTRKVKVGDRLGGSVVSAIAQQKLTLSTGGQKRVLRQP